MAIDPAMANIHHAILTLYANPCSHLFIDHHATGVAITIETATSRTNSFESNRTIPAVLDPNTLRTPISFFLWSALKATRPNNPRQEIRMAIMVNELMIRDKVISDSYCFWTSSSRKAYSNGTSGRSLCQMAAILPSSD